MPIIAADAPCPCRSNRPFAECHADLPWNRVLSRFLSRISDDAPMLKLALASAMKGNLPLAELLLQGQLSQSPHDPAALSLLAEIALKCQMHPEALALFEQALAAGEEAATGAPAPCGTGAAASLLRSYLQGRTPQPGLGKYLLIKAWGYGFWSDVDHLLGALLVAELTGRVPVVSWGKNSLFGDGSGGNAFDLYFEPVSQLSAGDLTGRGLSFYPPKWNEGNLLEEDVDKWAGPHCRQSPIQLLGRREDVAVTDFHIAVAQLLPWMRHHPLYGSMKWHQVYRHLFDKHLKLKPRLQEMVEEFHRANMAGRRWLGVHVRGSDKVLEQRDLELLNQQYYSLVDGYLQRDSELEIFLMTDSSSYLEAFRNRYGGRVLTTEARRTDGMQGVHLMGHSGKEIGESVILDSYLAARCDYFIGNGASNVSAAVGSLKDWPEGAYLLLGRDLRSNCNATIHNW